MEYKKTGVHRHEPPHFAGRTLVSYDDPFQIPLVIEMDRNFLVELGIYQVILTSQNLAHHLSEP